MAQNAALLNLAGSSLLRRVDWPTFGVRDMNGRAAFTLVAVAAGIYVLYKSQCRRLERQRQQREAQANWENEGGAAAPPPPGSAG
jgi:hypothetical protein